MYDDGLYPKFILSAIMIMISLLFVALIFNSIIISWNSTIPELRILNESFVIFVLLLLIVIGINYWLDKK